ncbi:MAG TPA: hypothetical protein VGQ20_00425 [Acidimicrobiales bacterium]|jgi:hypothetical protein|nr:hypothetical protein [Acidimicrobiales bacterium]
MNRKLVLGVLAALLGLFALAMPAAAQPTGDQDGVNPNHCFEGAGDGGTLTKSLISVVNNGNGTWTITYHFVSSRGAGTFDKLDDCAFIDLNHNQTFDAGEALFTKETKPVTLGAGGTVNQSIVVVGSAGQTVCDRGALSGTAGLVSFTDKSNVLCVPLTPFVIPSGAVGGLGFAAVVAGGVGVIGLFALMRRRRHATSAV